MLKTSNTELAEPKKGRIGFGGDSRARRGRNEIDRSGMDNVKVDDGEVEVDEVGKKGQKTSKSKNWSKSKKTIRLDFLTPGARLAFTKLRQAFVKASILYHFNPKYHIQIKTNVLGYAIGGVLNQLTLDDLGQ